MKSLIVGLAGTGFAAVLFLAYLSMSQQQEVKKEVQVDKATFEVESARFDKEFNEKWQELGGKSVTRNASTESAARLQAAERTLSEAKKRQVTASQHSERDLAELRAVIDSLDDKPPTKTIGVKQ